MAGLTEANVEGFDSERWVPFLGWASRELSKCLANIGDACDAALEGRPLPPPLYAPGGPEAAPASIPVTQSRGRGRPKTVRDPNKPKRQPSAFNQFVKERIEALKAEGYTADPQEDEGLGNALFKKAVDEWRLLSDAERSQYTQQYKAHVKEGTDGEAAAAAAIDEINDQSPAPPSPEPSSVAARAPAAAASPATAEKKKRKKDKGESLSDKSEHKKKHKKKSKPAATAE